MNPLAVSRALTPSDLSCAPIWLSSVELFHLPVPSALWTSTQVAEAAGGLAGFINPIQFLLLTYDHIMHGQVHPCD